MKLLTNTKKLSFHHAFEVKADISTLQKSGHFYFALTLFARNISLLLIENESLGKKLELSNYEKHFILHTFIICKLNLCS
jgi:hypothetical protein